MLLSSQGNEVGFASFREALCHFEEHGMTRVKKQEKAPKSCQECEHWAEVRNKLRVGQVLETVITKMETKLKEEDFKPTLADYMRLVQLQKEIGDDGVKEITVTWVEPGKSSTET
jgi:hypothetical protein